MAEAHDHCLIRVKMVSDLGSSVDRYDMAPWLNLLWLTSKFTVQLREQLCYVHIIFRTGCRSVVGSYVLP
jgi:hypothetical protein